MQVTLKPYVSNAKMQQEVSLNTIIGRFNKREIAPRLLVELFKVHHWQIRRWLILTMSLLSPKLLAHQLSSQINFLQHVEPSLPAL
jgi:hypothetical protein